MVSPTQDEPNPTTATQSLPCKKPDLNSSNTLLDSPPESFWVPKCDENEWFNQNAVMERKNSRKLTFSSTPTDHRHANPVSLRSGFYPSQSPKPSLIGFSPVRQKSSLSNESQRQNKTGNMFLYRSRSEPGMKSASKSTEPGSPQVNCLGRVGSNREKGKKIGVWFSICKKI